MNRVDGDVALVPGGAPVIGAATANVPLHTGARAVLTDQPEARGRALAGELGNRGWFP